MPSKAENGSRTKHLFSVTTAFAGILLVACLAVVILAGLSLARSREQYQRRAEITAQNLCAVLADNLVTSYEKIDLALLGVKEEVEQRLATGTLDGPRLETFLERQRAKIPVLFALRTANPEGIIDHGNDVPPGSRISVIDRDYFVRLKTDPNAGLVFSKPLKGRVTGKWAIILARRINRRDGSFGGVIYGAMELEKMGARFASVSVGRDGAIALRDSDLAIIVRQGGSQDTTGQTAISPEFRAMLQAGRVSGTYMAHTAVDRVARIHSFIKLQPYGQYLNVGLGGSEVFEPWRRELHQTLGFVAVFLLLIGASTWVAYRAWQRQQQAEAEVTALSGLLPICSNCKKIRDDHGYWNQIEAYISSHSEAQFTHGMCPDCIQVFFPEICEKRKAKQASTS